MLFRESLTHLHAHFAHDPTLVTMFVHYLTGIPYSFTAHAKDIYVKTSPELLRDEAQAAEAVVTCTEYNRRYMSAQIGPAGARKLHCIYHGLDLSPFKFSCRRALASEPMVILSVARLVEKKGLRDLIAAAERTRVTDSLAARNRPRGARRVSPWALRREFRSTYRDKPASSETIVEGKWFSNKALNEPADTGEISLEDGISRALEGC